SKVVEEQIDHLEEEQIAAPQVDGEDDGRHDDDDRPADDFVAARPRDLLHLGEDVVPPLSQSGDPLAWLVDDSVFHQSSAHISVGWGWQAKRDSNPQPAVLETAALRVELLACNCRKSVQKHALGDLFPPPYLVSR